MLDLWNWSLWILIPAALIILILAIGMWWVRDDPKIVAQRNRNRNEGLRMGRYPHPGWMNISFLIVVACWILAGISFSRSQYWVGIGLVVLPPALMFWVGSLEKRHYRQGKRP